MWLFAVPSANNSTSIVAGSGRQSRLRLGAHRPFAKESFQNGVAASGAEGLCEHGESEEQRGAGRLPVVSASLQEELRDPTSGEDHQHPRSRETLLCECHQVQVQVFANFNVDRQRNWRYRKTFAFLVSI